MPRHTAHRRMLGPDASIRRPAVFGPRHRPAGLRAVELCVCGIQYTTYWAHRQTAHHQQAMRAERATQRAAIRDSRIGHRAA